MKSILSKIPSFISYKLTITLSVILITLCAVLPRYSDLSMPLLDFHPTRQLFGAIKARGYYYQNAKNIPDWQKQIAERQINVEAVIEPPLLETVSAWLYDRYGENTAFPRAISTTIWLIGGVFLFLFSRNLSGSAVQGMVAVAFYELLPYGISASRAFQPDPLMICMIIIFWWALERWMAHKGLGWAIAAGLLGGLAIFVKFTAVFFIVFPAIGFLLADGRLLLSLKDPKTWLVAILGVLPAGAYFYYGTFVDPFLVQQFGGRFFVDKWIDPFFYLRWWMIVDNVIPVITGLTGLIGMFFFAKPRARTVYFSMMIGYVVFGFTFAHHIASHDYYSLPLIPIFALLLGEFAQGVLARFGWDEGDVPTFVFALFAFFAIITTGVTLVEQRALSVSLENEVKKWETIGAAIGHQPGVISLTTDYGYPLEYYGYQNTNLWPSYADIEKLKKEFPDQAKNKSYFLITDFAELTNQPGLLPYLNTRYPVLSQSTDYILFNLNEPLKKR